MRKILRRKFFDRDTVLVAEEILGKFLVRKIGQREVALMITEVEVYDGFRDQASHASRGKTKRNEIMFGEAGHWYVYFTYGMHWMLNLVTREEGYPAAILIRGVEGFDGPAKLTKFLKIDKKINRLPIDKKSGLWVEDRGYKMIGEKIHPPKFSVGKLRRVKKGPRVGVSYAGPVWAKRKLRFWV